MDNYLELGPVPVDESCVQVDKSNEYLKDMLKECKIYKNMLESKYPNIKDFGCYFSIKDFQHDFGTYIEVVVNYNDEDYESETIALDICNNLPLTWSNEALENFKIREELL